MADALAVGFGLALAVGFGLALGVGDAETVGEGAGIVGNDVKVGIGDCAEAFASGRSTGAPINAGSATRMIPETMSAVVRTSIPEYTRYDVR